MSFSVFHKDSNLSDIVFSDPSVISVLNRFGIYLGVGNGDISAVCAGRSIDVAFLLEIINTYLHPDYIPDLIPDRLSLISLIEYLDNTDNYYIESQLPNVDRHFNSLLRINSGKNSNLHILNKFYSEFNAEMQSRIDSDKNYLFPKLHSLELSLSESELDEICMLQTESDVLEDKLSDLLSFFVIHLKGEYDPNLCLAVVSALFTLERDVKHNNRIRTGMLIPLLRKMSLRS